MLLWATKIKRFIVVCKKKWFKTGKSVRTRTLQKHTLLTYLKSTKRREAIISCADTKAGKTYKVTTTHGPTHNQPLWCSITRVWQALFCFALMLKFARAGDEVGDTGRHENHLLNWCSSNIYSISWHYSMRSKYNENMTLCFLIQYRMVVLLIVTHLLYLSDFIYSLELFLC